MVGVVPNPAALLRLAGAVLVETRDEWEVAAGRTALRRAGSDGRRRFPQIRRRILSQGVAGRTSR